MASPALLRTSAARAATRSIGSVTPSAPRQQLLSTLSKSAGSSSSSSSSSSKATRATAVFALGASFVVLGLTSSKLHLESSIPADPPAKRVSWSDRVKANVGGSRIIQRIQEVIEGEDDEEEEEQAEEESESSSSTGGASHPLDEEAPLAVEAVAQVVSEDPGSDDSQAAAFDPATGTINWDCPCLGGMAHGPCGEDFKAAFSCFVYSEREPKGIECVDKFKAMQDCFRRYPEVYKEELEMEEQDEMDSLVSEVEQALGVERSQSS